jgi:hypothetical protein
MKRTDWRKTKCCGTCALWNIERAKDASGKVQNRPAECAWALSVPLPASLWARNMPKPSWMCRDYGTDCAAWTPRDSENTKGKEK